MYIICNLKINSPLEDSSDPVQDKSKVNTSIDNAAIVLMKQSAVINYSHTHFKNAE